MKIEYRTNININLLYPSNTATITKVVLEESDKGTIYLLEDINISRKKIMSAVTDSDCEIKFDEVNKPGVSNLLTIESSLTGESIASLEENFPSYPLVLI